MRKQCRYLAVLFCLLIVFFAAEIGAYAEEKDTVYISVEKFTIGQGYLITPTKFSVEKGTSVSQIVETLLIQNGYELNVNTSSGMGWYLAGIVKADSGNTRIPLTVMDLDTFNYEHDYRTKTGIIPPSENYAYPELAELAEFSYGTNSGWYYYVNNVAPDYTMEYYQVADQDVIRLQYTACSGDLAMIPDIDKGIKSLAIIKDYLAGNPSDTEIKSISEKSLMILSDMDAQSAYTTQLQNILSEISQDLSDGVKDGTYSSHVENTDEIYDKIKAEGVICRIDRLPAEVTLEDQELIEDVNSLYQELTSEQKQLVGTEKSELLNTAVDKLDQLLEEKQKEENQKKAKAVIDKINAIGTVTLEKEKAITAARAAYNALEADARDMISSAVLSKLIDAETKLASLKKTAALIKKYTPAKVKLVSVKKSGKKAAKITWKKLSACTGYQIYMSKKKNKGYKKIKVLKGKKKKTFRKTGLKKKKTYFFKVRAYRKVGSTTYYGAWSNIKKIKIK